MIEFKNVTYRYNTNEQKALDDVSFTIEDGKWVSILGHNGSGKSTIAKLMIGLLEATSGQILYDDKVLSDKTID
ncbi:MAG: ATP-binding cassette domain-containing protein, partial [Anaeroplasmataceae bacterium]|nr:ATP-binding cassette domain-containing protein [Anaeroplasmataceae bacterium]